jgi:hypothetical protein
MAEPVRRVIIPLLPLLLLPDENERDPETPLSPEFLVRILNDPLDVARPYPDTIDTAPPVLDVDSPALSTTRPPAETFPCPTKILKLPPVPNVADPVLMTIAPVLPALEVPETKERDPLVPLSPALAVRTLNEPLDFAVPKPVIIETAPPVFTVLSPLLTTKRPPPAREPDPTRMLTLPAVPRVAIPLFKTIAPLLP